jgi:hypothetical protein
MIWLVCALPRLLWLRCDRSQLEKHKKIHRIIPIVHKAPSAYNTGSREQSSEGVARAITPGDEYTGTVAGTGTA